MKLIIGHTSMGILAKTLRFMAKYSGELFMHALPDQLLCKVLNSSTTAVAEANFDNKFFVKYELSESEASNIVKVPFRPLLNCVKNAKQIASCTITIEDQNDRMIIKVKKESGIEATHKVYLLEPEEVTTVEQKDVDISEIACHPAIFKRLHGSSNEFDEIVLQFKEKTLLIENYIENIEEDFKTVRIHYLISKSDFNRYDLRKELSLVFSWPDFSHVVDMALQAECQLLLRFSHNGMPLIVILDTGASYTIRMALITMKHAKTKPRKNEKIGTYRDKVQQYVQENNLKLTTSQFNRMASPNIISSNSSEFFPASVQPAASIPPQNITEKDMDEIAATLARKNATENPNNTVTLNSTILTQREMEEVEEIMRNAENFEDMEVDPIEELTPMRPKPPDTPTNSYQASRQNLLEMQRIPEEPIDDQDQLMEEVESHNVIPSEPILPENRQNVGKKLSTQEKREMRIIKSIFTSRRSQNSKLNNAKDLCPGSDSEESMTEENE